MYNLKQHWYLILPLIVFFVSYCDLGITLYCDEHIEKFEEANPIALYVWETYGVDGLIIFKMGLTTLSCVCMGLILATKNRFWRVAVTLFGLGMCLFLTMWWIFWFFL